MSAHPETGFPRELDQFEQDYGDLDPGIKPYVRVLMERGVETFESCQGGEDHAYAEPTVRFHLSGRQELWRALWAAQERGLPVDEVRLTWVLIDGNPTGPYGEIVFREKFASPEQETE